MSRSNNTDLKNPATRFFEWDGSKGGFRYFDKTIGENGERVAVSLPFTFLVLDSLSTIKGFSDSDKSGYWSNEIRQTKSDILTVRTKKGIQAEGLYEQVITSRALTGAKYCQSVYIGFLDGTDLMIGNIGFTGAALSAWIDFRKKNDVMKGAIKVASMIEGKKGATVYQIPVFQTLEVKPETEVRANELDKELQKYLTAYFAKNKDVDVAAPIDHDVTDEQPPYRPDEIPAVQNDEPQSDDLPF